MHHPYIAVIIGLIWLWLIKEAFNTPTIDEYGNYIDKKERERNKKYH